jgi:hypothetical protein
MAPIDIPDDLFNMVVTEVLRTHDLRHYSLVGCHDNGQVGFKLSRVEEIFAGVNGVLGLYIPGLHTNHEAHDAFARSAEGTVTACQAAACGLLLSETPIGEYGNPNQNWRIRLFGLSPTRRVFAFPYVLAAILRHLHVDPEVELIANHALQRAGVDRSSDVYDHRWPDGTLANSIQGEWHLSVRYPLVYWTARELRKHVEVQRLPVLGDPTLYQRYTEILQCYPEVPSPIVDQTLYAGIEPVVDFDMGVIPITRFSQRDEEILAEYLDWGSKRLLAEHPELAAQLLLPETHSRRVFNSLMRIVMQSCEVVSG